MTKDPTSSYMFVMKYYKNGDLYSYLEETMGVLCWRDIVDILWSISTGLNFIHELDLVHGHLHGGNILIESEMDSIDAKITDTGLHGPVNKQIQSQPIYDETESSDISNQFDTAEEIKFENLEKLNFNNLSNPTCHEKAVYYSRPLDVIYNDFFST